MSNVRIGLLGAGRIAQSAHLPAISKCAGVELVGLYDLSPLLSERVSRRYAVQSYGDMDALLADSTIGIS